MSNSLYRLYAEKLGNSQASQYIGKNGDMFYDPDNLSLRMSDGHTPGGKSALVSDATVNLPVTKSIFVDGNRTDSYTPTGNILLPFKKIQDALNIATAGLTIYIAPGTYTEDIIIPNLDGLAIIGSSEMNTVITNATSGTDTITWIPSATPGALVHKFALKYMTIVNTSNNYSIKVDAAAVLFPDSFVGDEFDITEVDFDGDMYFRNTGIVYWNHGDCEGHLNVVDCATFRLRNIEIGSLAIPKNLNLTYEGTHDIHNGVGRTDYTIGTGSVIFGNLNIIGHPVVQLDPTSLVVGSVSGTALTSFYSSGRSYCPLMSIYGQIGLAGTSSGITLNFPDPNASGAAYSAVDLSGAHIAGQVSLTKANNSPYGSFSGVIPRWYAYVTGQAHYDTTSAGGISVNGYVSLDLKASNYNQTSLSGNVYSIVDRNQVIYRNQAVSNAGSTIDISPILPSANYALSISTNTGSVNFSTKRANSFVVTASTTGVTADIVLTRIS